MMPCRVLPGARLSSGRNLDRPSSAMHWALAVPVAILVAGALACLAMRELAAV